MKILFCINSLRVGGAERMVVELSKVMVSNHDITILSISDDVTSSWIEELNKLGVKCITLGGSYCSLRNIIKTYQIIQRERFDVVHTHLTYAQIYGAFIQPFYKKCKWVTTEHSNNNNRRKYKLFKTFDRWLYQGYDSVLSISSSVQESLLKWLRSPCLSKFAICPNGVNTELFRNASTMDRRSIELSDKDVVLMMVGRMADAKDSPTIMRALKLLPDRYKLVLIGDGPMMDYNKKYADEIGVAHKTVFLGAQYNIPSWMKMADVYIQSSHWEGMPTTVLEAMASGVVVIGSSVPGNNDVLTSSAMFPHEDHETLVTMLLKSDLETLREEQQQVIMQYDLRAISNKLISVYDQ